MKQLIPFALLLMISGCDRQEAPSAALSAEQKKELAEFIQREKSDMVYMPAGSFLMGDFCREMNHGGLNCSAKKDDKPLHQVALSAFSISKFKITHEDYDFYLKMSGLPPQKFEEERRNKTLAKMTALKNSPAIISWGEADNYCRWLKKQTGLNVSLPTEAQWEYAARDKGKYIVIATDDGTLRYNRKTGRGENFATDEDRDVAAGQLGILFLLIHFPVDQYPPSPAGLYGMADNGREWVLDWYDPEWYQKSPRRDPQGPEKGVIKDDEAGQYWKVLRGADHPAPGRPSGMTFSRSYEVPEPGYPAGVTARCVVNEPEPLNGAAR
ncbi:formylglycine-generating enzyme family protein [Pantoea sp. FN060301]|uniref:formylglycine-generating enzyme family protein n=1 Tax=Pantoea sp. FN060301 TaxID=3420380 RepID=UPI003D166C86